MTTRSSNGSVIAACMLLATGCAGRTTRSTLPYDARFEAFIGMDERPLVATQPRAAPPPAVAAQSPAPPPTPVAGGFVAGAPQSNRYAIVVGIENYREARQVPGAAHDAKAFADMARVTMGVPESHLKLLVNERATKTDLESAFAWVGMRTNPRSEVVVFFAGHGSASPDASNKLSPLLFTYESNPSDPATAITLPSLLTDLSGQARPNAVIAFVDACSENIRQTSRGGVVFSPQSPSTIVYSAASVGELSSPVADGSAGLFTSRLLDAIGHGSADLNGDAEITLQELDSYVTNRVRRYATETLGKRQTPSLATQGRIFADKLVLAQGLAGAP